MKQKFLTFLLALVLASAALLPATSQAITIGVGDRSIGTDQAENFTVVDPIDSSPAYATYDAECDNTEHIHWHTNTSTDTSSREYWGVVHSFAIVFEEDFLENVDTSTLLCTNGKNIYKSCGFDKDNDLGEVVYESIKYWDGIKVTYQTLNWIEGSPVGLVWEYGTDDPSDIDLKPWISTDSESDTHYEGVSFTLRTT